MSSRRLILYAVLVTILGAVAIYGIAFKVLNINQVINKPLQDSSVELVNEWVNYLNESNMYQYGVTINVTNTGQSILELSNLQLNVTGIGRDKIWSTTYPTKNLVLIPGQSEEINLRSQNVPASSLGYVGASGPAEYLDFITNTMNLGLSVIFEGTVTINDKTKNFKSEVEGLKIGSVSTQELVYARDLNNLGLTSRWIKRWAGTFSYLPVQDLFRYQGVQHGVIGTSKLPIIVVNRFVHSRYQSVSLEIENARTITITDADPPKVYYLIDRGYEFESYLKDKSLIGGESVYFYGDAYDYLAQDGSHYEMLFLTDVNTVEMRDPLTVAKSYIVSRVGVEYYEKYYSDPMVDYRPGQGDDTYVVNMLYHITVGDYSENQTIYLFFDQNLNLTEGEEYLPVAGNLQPFKVTEDQAVEIAIEAGISVDPYGIWTGISNNGVIRGTPTVYQGMYVWQVGTWIDPPGSNPRMFINALIDPITGELYALQEGGVGYVG